MSSDPIADMLNQIVNAGRAGKETTSVIYSKQKEEILKILKRENFIKDYQKEERSLRIVLSFTGKNFTILGVKKISKPGLRKYTKAKRIKKDYRTIGITIISTPKGVMTQKEALKQNLGGEVICQIW